MIDAIRANLGPMMFGGLIVFLLIGYPAAFSLAAVGLSFSFIAIEMGVIAPQYMGNLTFQLYSIISNDLLLSIPFFTFMGAVLERCGLAEDLLYSIGQLFGSVRGGLSYAVILVGAILGAITGTVPAHIPALPPEARTLKGWALAIKCVRGIVPSAALIFLVLGTIFMGLATPTEAGAMGAVGALALAAMYRTLTWKLTYQAMSSTMRITAMVTMILIGARVFSLVFQGVGGGLWIEHMLTGLPGGQVGFLAFTMVFVFFIAFFLDFSEIAFIIIPLLTPAAAKLDINLIWFGLLICANIQTSFMHPPFGFALFYLRGIAPPTVKSHDIYLGSIPWIVLQLILVALMIAFPEMVTYWLDKPVTLDPAALEKQLNSMPGLGNMPGLNLDGLSPPKP
jgi:TRAP-type mannitol/chloroaromatic compound transport system permease large subunit